MESRMEKYYKEDLSELERTKKNEKLYKEVYGNYNEFENIPIPDNSDVIDVASLKKMVTSRDEYHKLKEFELIDIVKKEPLDIKYDKEQRKVYDINELLEQAKRENSKIKEITREQITRDKNFLMTLEAEELPKKEENLKIDDTKYHTKNINKDPEINQIINTNSLPLDILTDLKPTDDTIVSEPILEETRKLELDPHEKTFYSGSYTFSKKDFVDEEDELPKSNHYFLKVFCLVVGLAILATVIFYFIKYYNVK